MTKTLTAKLTRGLDNTKEYGKISKIILPDKSKIYITKKGWSLVTPKGIAIRIPYSEINLAISETIAQGYIIKKEKKCQVKQKAKLVKCLKCGSAYYTTTKAVKYTTLKCWKCGELTKHKIKGEYK